MSALASDTLTPHHLSCPVECNYRSAAQSLGRSVSGEHPRGAPTSELSSLHVGYADLEESRDTGSLIGSDTW